MENRKKRNMGAVGSGVVYKPEESIKFVKLEADAVMPTKSYVSSIGTIFMQEKITSFRLGITAW